MSRMVFRSIIISAAITIIAFVLGITLELKRYIDDIGSISAFLVVFGTLYGIMTAFIVVEVWTQHNKTAHLFEQEAEELEKLYRLSLHFKNPEVSRNMKRAVKAYGNILIDSAFKHLSEGQKHHDEEIAFRQITHVIKEIALGSDHEQVVFDHIVHLYGELAQTRIERTHQSTLRLPLLLKNFFYISTVIIVAMFVVLPFAHIGYSMFSVSTLVFLLAMIAGIIEELDNPFIGFWRLSAKPFEEALFHIEESY